MPMIPDEELATDEHGRAVRVPPTAGSPGVQSRRDALQRISSFLFSGSLFFPVLSDHRFSGLVRGDETAGRDAESLNEGADSALLAPVGVQLYTLRSEMAKSVEKTLERVAKIGYREVEFAGYYNKSPKEIVSILKANRISAPSAHVDLDTIRKKWGEALDVASEIGHQYVVCPWIPENERQSANDYRRVAADLNKAAEAAKARGIGFAYHNHDFEFKPLAGTIGYDILLAETDPKLVKMELDLYWITKGGRDPIQYFNSYPRRFPLVHVKDMTTDGQMVDVGSGTIPFAKIFAKAKLAGIEHYFVEHDNPQAPFASINASYRALRALKVP